MPEYYQCEINKISGKKIELKVIEIHPFASLLRDIHKMQALNLDSFIVFAIYSGLDKLNITNSLTQQIWSLYLLNPQTLPFEFELKRNLIEEKYNPLIWTTLCGKPWKILKVEHKDQMNFAIFDLEIKEEWLIGLEIGMEWTLDFDVF